MYVLAVGYTSDILYFSWLEKAVEIDDELQLPQFELVNTTLRDCSQNYTAGMMSVRSSELSKDTMVLPGFERSGNKAGHGIW